MRFSLHAGLTLRCGTRTLEVVRQLGDDEFQLEDCYTRRPLTLIRSALLKKIWDGHYTIVLPGSASSDGDTGDAKRGVLFDLSTLSAIDREQIEYRLKYVQALHKAHVKRGQRARVAKVVQGVSVRTKDLAPPSASTVMGWARAYETSGHSPTALLSGNRRRRAPRRKPQSLNDLIARMIKTVYLTRGRHTLQHTLDRINAEAKLLVVQKVLDASQATVSLSTLCRRVKEVDLYRRIAAREGESRARMLCRTVMGGAGASYPLERVEVDHTVLNWVVICDRTGLPLGRPVLTVMIDAYSGYVLGFYLSFYGPGLTSVTGVIRNAVRPKDDFTKGIKVEHPWRAHGVGDEFVLDNGLEFHAASFKVVSWELGANLMYCRVRTPWPKPHVERFFGTLNTLTLMRGRVHKSVANVVNLNPDKDAAITFSDLVRGLVMFVSDVHPFEINERKLARPYDLFTEGIERCPPAHYPGSWDQLRLASALSKELTVSPGGIELHGLPYGSEELLAMRKRLGTRFKALVKWDPDDMEFIYVRDPELETWVASPCRWSDYASGLSWNQHLMIRKFARAELKNNGAYEGLQAARLRLNEHWLEATSRRNRVDATAAARFSGVTSARVMAASGSPKTRVEPPSTTVADTEVRTQAAETVIPDFETFEMTRS